jgi:hypothetical protein
MSQLLGARAWAADVFFTEKTFEWAFMDLGMMSAVIFELYPGLRRLIQKIERELLFTFQHRKESMFDLGPKALLFSILLRGVGKRLVLKDREAR